MNNKIIIGKFDLKSKVLHQLAMWTIVIGAIILFYLSFVWFTRDNIIMAGGMFVMGIVALSNFYLHRRMMG